MDIKLLCILAATLFLLSPSISYGFCQDETPAPTAPQGITADVFRRAARNGDLATVKKSIEAGIEVDAQSAYGATALFFACDRGQEDVVDFLLAQGADPNIKDSFYDATPVTWSMMHENQDITLKLLKHGGEFEAVLQDAISSGDEEYARKIVELKNNEKVGLIEARNAAMRIKDEDERNKMVAIFASLELPDPVVVSFSSEILNALVGKYASDEISVEITVDGEKPMIAFDGDDSIELVPNAETGFTVRGDEASFEIKDGDVAAIDFEFGEETINLKRVTADAEGPDGETDSEVNSEFGPSSADSLAADAKISSANWPGFRGAGSRGVAQGQKPPLNFHVVDEEKAGRQEDRENQPGEKETEDGEKESDEKKDNEKTEDEMLLWKTPIEGLGLSSPSIWDDQIFITTAVAEGEEGELQIGLFGDVDSVEETQDYEFKLLCYSKFSGEKLWERIAHKAKPAVKRHSKSSHANPTVAVNDQYVVAFFGSEGLYCYSKSGDLIWKRDLGYLDSGWFYDKDYQWGFASSPTIHNDQLFVQCDIQTGSFVACFDLATGDEVWRTQRDEIPSWSTPLVHEFEDSTMVVTNGTKSSRGYDAATGEVLWQMKGNSEIVVPTPNVARGLIFISSGYAPIRPVYAIKPDAKGDISLETGSDINENVAWSKKKGGPYMPTPIIYGDYLYCCANNGIVTCFVAESGEQVYKKRLSAGGGKLAFSASPLAADGHLYFTAEDGRVLVVKAGPEFEIVATNHLNQSVLATPAISEGAMFFRTQSSLIAVGQRITD